MSGAMNTLAQNVIDWTILICQPGDVIMDNCVDGYLFCRGVHFSLTPLTSPYNMRALWKR